ncbi:hypothetical protein E2562_018932 [Oryza meyeriana var. granulata]|uniref:Uncharacterized protein n=1 Tax=Oryza meyeriana var. granulata TaxID=110450 RepID=A0A6G1DIN3_9ORYZ|nr:hypothetical protein E2562_018932 [Oryza meyeriana var. granulata]
MHLPSLSSIGRPDYVAKKTSMLASFWSTVATYTSCDMTSPSFAVGLICSAAAKTSDPTTPQEEEQQEAR